MDIFRKLEKLEAEGLVSENAMFADVVEASCVLHVACDDVRMGGHGKTYEEVLLEFHRGGKRQTITINLADIVGQFVCAKVKIRIEAVKE